MSPAGSAPGDDLATCPVCGEPLASPGAGARARTVIACRACATPHHLECFQFSRGCALFGCRSRACGPPAEHPDSGALAADDAFAVYDLSGPHEWAFTGSYVAEFFAVFVAMPALMTSTHGGVAAWLAYGLVALPLLVVLHSLLRRFVVRDRLVFDGGRRSVARARTVLGLPLGRPRAAWVPPGGVREVHVHRYVRGGEIVEAMYLALSDGTRPCIYATTTAWKTFRLPSDALRALAERIAQATGSTVRLVAGRALPPASPLPALAQADVPAASPAADGPCGACTPKARQVPRRPTCPACQERLAPPAIACARCGAIHHHACWQESRGCAVAGCGGLTGAEPVLRAHPAEPFAVEAPLDLVTPCWWLTCTLLALILLVTVLAALGEVDVEFVEAMAFVFGPLLLGDFLLLCVASAGVSSKRPALRRTLVFEPARGLVHAQLMAFGWRLGSERRAWLTAGDIVEVHRHQALLGSSPCEGLFLALRDGRRLRLYESWRSRLDPHEQRMSTFFSADELDRVAARVADFADCTVRLLPNRAAPSAAELPGPSGREDATASG